MLNFKRQFSRSGRVCAKLLAPVIAAFSGAIELALLTCGGKTRI